MITPINRVKNDLTRLFKSGVFHVLVLLIGMRGSAFIQQVGLARIFSPDDLGKAIYILRIVSIVCVFADLGINNSVLKFSAEDTSKKEKMEIYRTGIFSVFVISLFVSLIYSAVISATNAFGEEELLYPMLLFSIYIPFASLRKIPPSYMQAQKQIQKAVKISGTIQMFLVVIILLFSFYYGLWGYFSVLVFGQAVIFFVFLCVTKTSIQGVRSHWRILKNLVPFGFFSMLANFTGIINATLGVLILKWFEFGYNDIAIYGVATVIVEAMRLAPKSLLRTVFPYLVSAKDNPQYLKSKVEEIMLKQGWIVLGLSVLVSISGYWLIPLVFGTKYADSWPCVVILSGALTLWSIGSPVGQLQMALNNVRLNFVISLIQLCANVLFAVMLVPEYGSIGAASALLLSRCFHCAFQVYYGYKTLRTLT